MPRSGRRDRRRARVRAARDRGNAVRAERSGRPLSGGFPRRVVRARAAVRGLAAGPARAVARDGREGDERPARAPAHHRVNRWRRPDRAADAGARCPPGVGAPRADAALRRDGTSRLRPAPVSAVRGHAAARAAGGARGGDQGPLSGDSARAQPRRSRPTEPADTRSARRKSPEPWTRPTRPAPRRRHGVPWTPCSQGARSSWYSRSSCRHRR